MNRSDQIIERVESIYQWIDQQLSQLDTSCRACGNCCDFESFGHKLYITTPELLYFQHHLEEPVKAMTADICPYRIDGKCSVYSFRFSGCRIYSCQGDSEKENELCELVIGKLKSLCDKHDIPYHYVYLKNALGILRDKPESITQNL